MKELKRLSTGFLSALLVLSFTLMPIPRVDRAWAEDSTTTETTDTQPDCAEGDELDSNGVYKPGCDLDKALTQAKLDNKYGNQDKWVAYVGQAVLSMMSVVLLDNLFMKYQYANDPKVYGNDCAENDAAQYTIRGAQVAALAYLIGEVQANIKYQELAKKAVDANFSAKAKVYSPSASSDEFKEALKEDKDLIAEAYKANHEQEKSFESLIAILEEQKRSIKSRMIFTTAAEIALAAVEVTELVNIKKCKARCVETSARLSVQQKVVQGNALKANGGLNTLNNTILKQAYLQEPANIPKECKSIHSGVNDKMEDLNKYLNDNKRKGEDKGRDNEDRQKFKETKFYKMLANIAGLFNFRKVRGEEETGSDASSPVKEVVFTESIQKDKKDDLKESTEDNKAAQETSIESSKSVVDYSKNVLSCEEKIKSHKKEVCELEKTWAQTEEETRVTRETACDSGYGSLGCPSAILANENAKTKHKLYQDRCKGSKTAVNVWPRIKEAIDDFIASDFSLRFSTTECCGFKGVSVTEAQNILTQLPNSYSMASSAGLDKTKKSIKSFTKSSDGYGIGDDKISLEKFLNDTISTYSPGKTVKTDAIDGSFVYQGFSNKSKMSIRQDITSFNPIQELKGNSSSSQTGGEKQSSLLPRLRKNNGYDMEYILPIVVENFLYDYALTHEVDWQNKNAKFIGRQVQRANIKVKAAVAQVKQLMQIEFNPPGPVLLGSNERMNNFFKGLKSILANFAPISSAHAIELPSGSGMAIGGIVLGQLTQSIGGPWAEVLNVGTKYMTLKGMLGMLGITELFVKPKSRAYIWGALMLLTGSTYIFDGNASKQVEENLKTLKRELARFKSSAAARTGVDGRVAGANANAALQKYDLTANQISGMKIKACATVKGNSFVPTVCPAVIPKSKVSLPELSKRVSNHLSADQFKGLSLMTDTLYGAVTGSNIGGSKLGDSGLETMNNTKNALRAVAQQLRNDYDKEAQKTKIGQSNDSVIPLAQSLGNFSSGFGLSKSAGGSNAKVAAVSGSAYKDFSVKKKALPSASGISKGSTGGGATGAGTSGSGLSDFDLDFEGDDEAGSVTNADDAVNAQASQKKEEKLEDFVLEHDDINKRSEVPIWKILSNRYILSYPKILEEDERKLEPDSIKK